MKNSFSIHDFFIIIKKPWKKHGRLHFISWYFHGFLFVRVFFISHESLNIKGDFNAFFMRFSCHIHGIFSWKTHENFPLNSPEKPMKNMWIYHEKFHWIFMGFNFIVYGHANKAYCCCCCCCCIHSSSSDKKFVIIWRLLMWVPLHFFKLRRPSAIRSSVRFWLIMRA